MPNELRSRSLACLCRSLASCLCLTSPLTSQLSRARIHLARARETIAVRVPGFERGLAIDDVNVDRASYELGKYEELPAVIVTEGLFGDILSDIVCARAGSPALCGSATVNPDRKFGRGATALFEPAHGSSPHRTGTRRSNPTGAWLALADLLEWCPDLVELGLHTAVRRALDSVLDAGAPTYDLARPGETTLDLDQFNERVLEALATVTA